jgi:regulatory protein
MDIKIKFNQNNIDIIIDGTLWKTTKKSFYRHIKTCHSAEDLEAAELKYSKNICIRLLSRQNYLSHALRRKLQSYNLSSQAIEYGIQECLRLGLINDELWIESFIRGQIRKKNGPHLIVQKLKMKGLKDHEFENFIPKSDPGSILKLLETRYRKYDLKNYPERQKVYAALRRKGFDKESINEAIQSLYHCRDRQQLQ